ncbi:hypothetical protein [Streptomyces sp. NPDC001292]|uniref:hypothetical protein n=1 Tax=Streptomyces sp. NPDC001292 TaxID=3364558 RepID=UPI00368A0FD7
MVVAVSVGPVDSEPGPGAFPACDPDGDDSADSEADAEGEVFAPGDGDPLVVAGADNASDGTAAVGADAEGVSTHASGTLSRT